MPSTIKNRVPQIVLLYWIIKIAATTLGETGADMFSMTFNLGYGSTIVIFLTLFLLLLGVKLLIRGYNPLLYWSVFIASAILGTGISDFIDRTLGLGYAAGSTILVALLLIVLGIWYKKERTIDVEVITSSTAELFYWLAFLLANTLGTAAGDFLADGLGIGFGNSAILISGLLFIIAMVHFFTRISDVLLFWLAFVLTRPFGASFGDLLTKPVAEGGIHFGTIGSSIFFGMILFLAISKERQMEKVRVTSEYPYQ